MFSHQLPQYYQLHWIPSTVWTSLVTRFTHCKLTCSRILHNFWLILVIISLLIWIPKIPIFYYESDLSSFFFLQHGSQSMLGVHHSSLAIIHFGKIARKHNLTGVCLDSLNRFVTIDPFCCYAALLQLSLWYTNNILSNGGSPLPSKKGFLSMILNCIQ